MADSKVSDLAALTGADSASTDLAVVVDVSDTTMAASGTTKKMTLAEFATGLITHGSLATDGEVTTAVSDHSSDTTSVHGITDTADILLKSTYNAHTVLYATTNDTPVSLTVSEVTVVGRITGGNIAAVNPSDSWLVVLSAGFCGSFMAGSPYARSDGTILKLSTLFLK
jgi:hypothetical protein